MNHEETYRLLNFNDLTYYHNFKHIISMFTSIHTYMERRICVYVCLCM